MQTVKPVQDILHVVTMISNPRRFRSRYALYNMFKDHMAKSHCVQLHTVEIAYGDREFELGEECIRLRTNDELWHKENALNIAISRLPSDWKYVAWIDADIQFTRPDWAIETIHMLQHHPVVQPWTIANDLGPNYESFNSYKSFAFCYHESISKFTSPEDKIILETNKNNCYYIPENIQHKTHISWHPGYAWACTREAFDHLGGLMDFCVVGSADRHMAHALIGNVESTMELDRENEHYLKLMKEWQNRAEKHIKRNIGYVNGTINHYWHGNKKSRRYHDRREIIYGNNFDPLYDIKKDYQGLWQLTGDKIKLRDDLMHYFQIRNEDSIDN